MRNYFIVLMVVLIVMVSCLPEVMDIDDVVDSLSQDEQVKVVEEVKVVEFVEGSFRAKARAFTFNDNPLFSFSIVKSGENYIFTGGEVSVELKVKDNCYYLDGFLLELSDDNNRITIESKVYERI